MSNTLNHPLGLNLLLDAESFLTDLTIENEAMITGGSRSRLRSLRSRLRSRRSRLRSRRRRRRSWS